MWPAPPVGLYDITSTSLFTSIFTDAQHREDCMRPGTVPSGLPPVSAISRDRLAQNTGHGRVHDRGCNYIYTHAAWLPLEVLSVWRATHARHRGQHSLNIFLMQRCSCQSAQ